MIRVAFIIGDYPPEERRLREDTAKSFSTAEVEVGILSVAPSPFGGLTPAEIQLVAPYFHAAYLQAEREGFDAAVPLGTLDLGVDGGRSLVDIPIVGPCEAMFHIAAQLGDNEWHPMRHQPRDEMNIAAQPVELCDQHRAFSLAGLGQGCRQLGPPIERVRPLAGLDLDMLADEFNPFGFSEALDSGFLGLDA